MDVATFKAIVDKYGGESKVIGIQFNNAARRLFYDEPFSYAKHLDEGLGVFVFKEKDSKGNEITVIKLVELVETIIFAKNEKDIPNIEIRYLAN